MQTLENKEEIQKVTLRSVLLVAVPTMVITLSRTMMGFVDFAFVAELSSEAVAAITPAGITMWVVIGFGMGTVSIVSTFASQSMGKGKTFEAYSYAWQGIYLGLIFGLLTLPLVPFVGSVMGWFGHAPKVLALEIEYASTILFSIGPSMVAYGLQCFFIGVNRAKVAMVAALIANVFNAGANYTLIFGHFGFPALGIAGAALGTVASTILQSLILMGCLSWNARKELGRALAGSKFMVTKIRQLCRFGVPAGMHWVIDILAWAFFTNILVGQFGTSHLAASNISLQLMHLSFMPAVGLGQALSALVGTSIGKKAFDLAHLQTQKALQICIAWMAVCGIIYWFFGGQLVGLLNSSPEVIAIGADIMKLAAMFQLFDALAICTMSTLKGAGDTTWTAATSFVCNWVIFIGGGWLMCEYFPEYGARGPWVMASACIIAVGIAYWFRYKSNAWRSINVFESERKARHKLWRPLRLYKVWRRSRVSSS